MNPITPASRLWLSILTRLLPAKIARRYREEWAAELAEMSPAQQRAHCRSLAVNLPRLCGAAAHLPGEPSLTVFGRSTPLCWIGMHRWRGASAEDGTRYLRCAQCGKDHQGRTTGAFGPIGLGN